MNKLKTTLIAMFVFAVMLTGQAFASLDLFQMVGSVGSTSEQTTFGWDETPYLYITFDEDVSLSPSSFWFDSGSGFVVPDTLNKTDNKHFWLSDSNWNADRTLGKWDVVANNCEGACRGTSFVVTPEPMALILYGLGGLPIAATLLRRRKVTV